MVSSADVHVSALSVAFDGLMVGVRVIVLASPTVYALSAKVMLSTATILTVTCAVAVMSPCEAVIVTVPSFLPVTTPLTTVAISSSLDVHVRVLSVASAGATVALICMLPPWTTSYEVWSRVMLCTSTTGAWLSRPPNMYTLLPGRVSVSLVSMLMGSPSVSPSRFAWSAKHFVRMIEPLMLPGISSASRRVISMVWASLPPLRRVSDALVPFHAAQP